MSIYRSERTGENPDDLFLKAPIDNYGLTLKDSYDLANLRAYERRARQNYLVRHQMPHETYL